MTDAFEVLWVLPGADIDLAVMHDWCCDEIALCAFAAKHVERVLWIGVEFPDHLAGIRLEAVEPPIAAGEDHRCDPVKFGIRGIRPLTVHDAAARERTLPKELARRLVECDETGRIRRRDV